MSTGIENSVNTTDDEECPVDMSCHDTGGGDATNVDADDMSKCDVIVDTVDDTKEKHVVEMTETDCDKLPDVSGSGTLHPHLFGRCESLEEIPSDGTKSWGGMMGGRPDKILVFSCSVPANMTAMDVSILSVCLLSSTPVLLFI